MRQLYATLMMESVYCERRFSPAAAFDSDHPLPKNHLLKPPKTECELNFSHIGTCINCSVSRIRDDEKLHSVNKLEPEASGINTVLMSRI